MTVNFVWWVPEPKRFAVDELGVCCNCGEQIERRQAFGWLHVKGLFLCSVPTTDGTNPDAWKRAEPLDA